MNNKIYLYRMTHIENIPHILQCGITHTASLNCNPDYKPIGDASLINTRNSFKTPDGKSLGDYIPFYFGYRMPMLYVVQKGYNSVPTIAPENIVYCVSSVQRIIDLKIDFVFTDGHAVNGLSNFYTSDEIENINAIVDFQAIKAKFWRDENDLDLKRRKEAEFLVEGDIPVEAILGYVVYDEHAEKKLREMGIDAQRIIVRPTFYF